MADSSFVGRPSLAVGLFGFGAITGDVIAADGSTSGSISLSTSILITTISSLNET